jgi:hypothetical protein
MKLDLMRKPTAFRLFVLLLLTVGLIILIRTGHSASMYKSPDNVIPPVISDAQEKRLLAAIPGHAIYLEGFLPCDDCPNQLKMVVKILDKANKQVNTVVIKEGFRQVPAGDLQASIIGKHVLIAGERAQGDQIVIFQLMPPFAVEKSIWCYHPTISNKGTRVAYISRMLRYTSQTNTTVISVLDMSDNGLKSHVVYPPENASKQDPEPWVESEDQRRILVSPISWNANDTQMAFFERVGDKNEFDLVKIDLREGLDAAAATYRMKINTNVLLKKGTPDIPEHLVFFVDKIRWLDDEKIEAILHPQYYWETQKLTLPIGSSESKKKRP